MKNSALKSVNKDFITQIIAHAIFQLEDGTGEGVYGCDLHNELFNTDYYVVGYYEAEQFINQYGGAFKAIHTIQNYEKEMFGKVTTDISNAESVANMLAYIYGELVLFECKHLQKVCDSRLETEDIEIIINQLESL